MRLSTRKNRRSSRRAPSPRVSSSAQSSDHQLARIAGDRLCRADRFGKIAAHLDDFLRPDRLDRFAHPSERLVEAAAGFRSKTQGERRARRVGEIRNCLEAEPPQTVDQSWRPSASAAIGNGRIACAVSPAGTTIVPPRAEARQCVGCTPAVGDCGARGKAGRAKPLHHFGEHRSLAAMQMIGAGRVDHNAVRRIGSDDRRIAAQRPQRQPLERHFVGVGLGIVNDQARNKRLRLARRHADAQARGACCRVGGKHDTAAPVAADQDERRLRRRRGVARFPSEAVCRPHRKEERYDPWHRMPPL